MNKNIILFGGKNITINFEPVADPAAEGGYRAPAAEEIKVRQIPVCEYESGFPLVNDESALVGFLCAKNKPWAFTLTPESHEEVLKTGREVNAKGFFSSCQRRTELEDKREAKAQADMIGMMASLPPETVRLVMEKGLAIRAQQHSPILSPGFVSPPVR
jgi:hypothetical protein